MVQQQVAEVVRINNPHKYYGRHFGDEKLVDITKCADPELRDCILRGTCYRNVALSTPHYQSWQDFTPNRAGLEPYCDHYIEVPCNPNTT